MSTEADNIYKFLAESPPNAQNPLISTSNLIALLPQPDRIVNIHLAKNGASKITSPCQESACPNPATYGSLDGKQWYCAVHCKENTVCARFMCRAPDCYAEGIFNGVWRFCPKHWRTCQNYVLPKQIECFTFNRADRNQLPTTISIPHPIPNSATDAKALRGAQPRAPKKETRIEKPANKLREAPAANYISVDINEAFAIECAKIIKATSSAPKPSLNDFICNKVQIPISFAFLTGCQQIVKQIDFKK